MTTDHDTLERIARQLCTDAGRDYDRKGCKRNYWRGKARRIWEIRGQHPRPVMVALLRAIGWQV